MKLSQLTILFVGIFFIIVVSTDIRMDNLTAVADNKEKMDYYMNQAIEDAANSLIQTDTDTGEEVLDRDGAVDRFLSSMYASLGILSDTVAQEKLRAYIPAIAVTDQDGYYLMYNDLYSNADSYTYSVRRWTEKTPYSYEDVNFIYRFTLGEEFSLYDKNNWITATDQQYEMTVQDLRTKSEYTSIRTILGSESFLMTEESYTHVRQQSVISHLEKDLSWYITKHNDIATHYGINYQFTLPVTDTSEWNKTIKGPGIIIIFQGMPLTEDNDTIYNRMAFSGGGILKDSVYYIEQQGWYYIYHKEGCPRLIGNHNIEENQYYSVQEVAALGCYSCEECDPLGVMPPDYVP